jgi:anti-sigma factor RsiW
MTANDHLLAGAYALGALDRVEALAFEVHLERCERCRAEVAELTETAAMLALAVPAPVNERLLESVLQEVRTTPQLPSERPAVQEQLNGRPTEPPAGIPRTSPRPSGGERTGSAGGEVVPLRRRRGTQPRWWLGAAAAIVLALLAGTIVARLGAEAGGGDEVAAILDDPGTRHVRLQSNAGEIGVHVSPTSGRAAVVAQGMPALDPAKTYELWFLADGNAHRAVTFQPDPSGTVRVAFPSPIVVPDAFGVTIEPAGGRDTPTLPLVAQAQA